MPMTTRAFHLAAFVALALIATAAQRPAHAQDSTATDLVRAAAKHYEAYGLAQSGGSIVVTRIYTGPDGQSHAEEVNLKLALSDGSTEVTEMTKATGVQFRRQAPNYFEIGTLPHGGSTSSR